MENLAHLIRQEWGRVEVSPPDESLVKRLTVELAENEVWVRDSSPDGFSVRLDNLVPSHRQQMLHILSCARTHMQNVMLHDGAETPERHE